MKPEEESQEHEKPEKQLDQLGTELFNGSFPIAELIPQLSTFLFGAFGFPAPATEEALKELVNSLKDNLYVHVEYPYVDKVYRDAYYTYYSKKRKQYPRNCLRVSLFDSAFSEELLRFCETPADIKESFLGFFVVRPTLPRIVGRTHLSPRAFKSNDYACQLMKAEALVNGKKMTADAFPYATQDSEVLSCAETTVWTLMEYFGTKYHEYKPVLPSHIYAALGAFSYERQIPSHGLSAEQISVALKSFGLGVRIYSASAHGTDLKRIYRYYIESGIPFVAILENVNLGHGIVVIGREHYPKTLENVKHSVLESKTGRKINIFDTADFEIRSVVMDDNKIPYRKISFDSPVENYDDKNFDNCRIHSIVVPLYEKIYLEALQARELAMSILRNDKLSGDISGDVVFRLQLTSSRSFKDELAGNESIDIKVRNLILSTVVAKFIWLVELSTPEQFSNGYGFALIVLDATEANVNSLDALVFSFHSNTYVRMVGRLPKPETIPFETFRIYDHNLRGEFSNAAQNPK